MSKFSPCIPWANIATEKTTQNGQWIDMGDHAAVSIWGAAQRAGLSHCPGTIMAKQKDKHCSRHFFIWTQRSPVTETAVRRLAPFCLHLTMHDGGRAQICGRTGFPHTDRPQTSPATSYPEIQTAATSHQVQHYAPTGQEPHYSWCTVQSPNPYSTVQLSGKDLVTADALSRVSIQAPTTAEDMQWEENVKSYINQVVQHLPASVERLAQRRNVGDTDDICTPLKTLVQTWWRIRKALFPALQQFW